MNHSRDATRLLLTHCKSKDDQTPAIALLEQLQKQHWSSSSHSDIDADQAAAMQSSFSKHLLSQNMLVVDISNEEQQVVASTSTNTTATAAAALSRDRAATSDELYCLHSNNGFVCDVCGHESAVKSDLLSHIRSRHTGNKPFTCSHCNASFSDRSNRSKHEQQHNKKAAAAVKPQCTICQLTFTFQVQVMNHMRLHHPKHKA